MIHQDDENNAASIQTPHQEPHFDDEAGVVEMPTTTTTSTASNGPAANSTEEADGLMQEAGEVLIPSNCTLPWILQILFGLYGLVIALFMLPLMYIVNTRVQVPVAYVSTYGAFVFLPYSFKPIYAYLCSSKTLTLPRWCFRVEGHIDLPSRHATYIAVLMINSVCMFTYMVIPPGGVALLFVVGFVRGVTNAWSALCTDLILIDVARVEGHAYHQQPLDSTISSQLAYDTIVSRFQSQAATLKNVGSVVGGSITFLVFLQRYLTTASSDGGDDSPTEQLSGAVVNGLVFLTGLLQVFGAGLAFVYRDYLEETEKKVSYLENFSVIQQDDSEDFGLGENRESATSAVAAASSEEDGLIGSDQSHSSYSSTEGSDDNFDDESLNASRDDNVGAQEARIRRRVTIFALVMMQVAIVLFVLKDPITSVTSEFVWKVLVVTMSSAFALSAVGLCYNRSLQFPHRVGIFLIVRNMVPSDAMVVASFVYSVFQSQPLLMQSLSVISLAVRMVSSWSYTKLWARFCQGHPLLMLIGGLVVLSSLASLLNVALFWKYQGSASMNENDMIRNVVGIAILSTVGTTFFSEWAFLPEVVLASVSAARSDKQGAATTTRSGIPPYTSLEDQRDVTPNCKHYSFKYRSCGRIRFSHLVH